MKIQKLFGFVVIRHTHTYAHRDSSARPPARQDLGYFSDNSGDEWSQFFVKASVNQGIDILDSQAKTAPTTVTCSNPHP